MCENIHTNCLHLLPHSDSFHMHRLRVSDVKDFKLDSITAKRPSQCHHAVSLKCGPPQEGGKERTSILSVHWGVA